MLKGNNVIYQNLFDVPIDQVNIFCKCLLIIPSHQKTTEQTEKTKSGKSTHQ